MHFRDLVYLEVYNFDTPLNFVTRDLTTTEVIIHYSLVINHYYIIMH